MTASSWGGNPLRRADGRGGGMPQVTSDLLFDARAGERLAAGQALVQDARQGVRVAARVVLPAAYPFRRHVGPGPDHVAGTRERTFPGRAGDPEVDEVGEVVFGDQNVGRLDVAVYQPDPMGGG